MARRLNGVLAQAGADAAAGGSVAEIEAQAAQALLEAGFVRVDYVAIRQAESLAMFAENRVDRQGRVLAAAWLGKTRLIDNMAVSQIR